MDTSISAIGKKKLPLSFPALSRHSNNLDNLLLELIGQINTDTELAKLRAALCMISRKQTESVHIPILRIKSLYSMILSVSQPHLSEEKVTLRSDHLAISCIQFPAAQPTLQQFKIVVALKAQELEATGCIEACNFLASQENSGEAYQLAATMYLPKSCSLLDTTAWRLLLCLIFLSMPHGHNNKETMLEDRVKITEKRNEK